MALLTYLTPTLLLLLILPMSTLSISDFDYADTDLLESATLEGDMRTFTFNSTYLLVAVAVGAVLILAIGAGLYFYDSFVDTTGRKDQPVPSQYDYEQYYQQQYQNAEYAYPAAAQQQYRYVKRVTHPVFGLRI